MERNDIIKILTLLKVAYPNFYKNMSKEDAQATIALYEDMFGGEDVRLISVAVKELISTSQYPPSIAEIKNKAFSITNKQVTPSELWSALEKAIRNGNYHSVEEFNKLPKECQTFLGSPSQLKELSQLDSDTVHSVTKGQFLKQIEIIQKRDKEEKQMLPETKNLRTLIGNIGQDVNKLLNE